MLAVLCLRGHPNPPTSALCRICGREVPEQQAYETPRPPLGVLRLSTGDVVSLDRGVIMGRAPQAPPGLPPELQPHVVRIASPQRDLSRNHVQVVVEGWQVILRDLDTTNGTTVTPRGGTTTRLRGGDPMVLDPGTVVSLAGEVSFTYEVPRRGPAVSRLQTTGAPQLPGLVYVQPLGSGGYADVYLYEQQSPRMPVAVKVLRSEGLTDALRRQFAEEADTMAALGDHPYIVQIFRGGTSADGRPYLVMKYYPPPNLARRARLKPLTVDEVLRTGIQLASAVETAHQAGIVHRDIKPANVLVSSYGAPGLTDFGIAGRGADTSLLVPPAQRRRRGVGRGGRLGPLGAPGGPLRPERGHPGASPNAATSTRSPPRSGSCSSGARRSRSPGGDNSAYALMPRIRTQPVPSTGRPDVPPSLERILAQSMAKDPALRPGSALELARLLQGVEQELHLARTQIVVLDDRGGAQAALPTSDGADATRVKSVQQVDGPDSSGVCAAPAPPPPARPPPLRPQPASSPPRVPSLRHRVPSSTSAPRSPARVSRRRPTADRWSWPLSRSASASPSSSSC